MIRLHGRNRYARTRVGWWAWALQRVTGVALVPYLFLHIGVISTAVAGEKTFNDVLAFLQTPAFVVLDLLLLAAVLYHAANGIRVILFDLELGVRAQAATWWAVVAVTLGIMAASTVVTWPLMLR